MSLEKIKQFVAGTPGAQWWVEELLFRGGRAAGPGHGRAPAPDAEGGPVVGAHVLIGVRYPDPLTGETRTSTRGPYPIETLPAGSALRELVGAVALGQQAQIAQHQAHAQALADEAREHRDAAGVLSVKLADAEARAAALDADNRAAALELQQSRTEAAGRLAALAERHRHDLELRDAEIARLKGELAAMGAAAVKTGRA